MWASTRIAVLAEAAVLATLASARARRKVAVVWADGMFGTTPAFGAAPATGGAFPSFGQQQAAPTPFGAPQQQQQQQQQQPLFGFGGQQQQQPQQQQQAGATPGGGGLFGSTATPLFGGAPAAASGSLFGAVQPQQQQQPAGGAQQLSLFGATHGPGGQPGGTSLFSGAGLQSAGLGAGFGQAGGPRPDVVLTTKTGGPVTHATKWEDLSPDAQAKLLSLECVCAGVVNALR